MRTQIVYLDKYDWLIKVFYLIEDPFIEGILGELDSIDCEPDSFYRAARMLEEGDLNSGFTYTDCEKHVTIMLIGKATSSAEFFSTFIHEIGHAATHIADYYMIGYDSEEIQYLTGEIALQMFQEAKDLMCDQCRINFYNYGKAKIKIKGGLN